MFFQGPLAAEGGSAGAGADAHAVGGDTVKVHQILLAQDGDGMGQQVIEELQVADAEVGEGQVLEDNSGDIEDSLGAYNKTVPKPPRLDDGGCSVGRGAGAASWLLAAFGLGALVRRRRR